MLNKPKEARLIDFDFGLTEEDFVKGIDHIYDKAWTGILSRLTVIVDEDNLKEAFE